MSKHYTIFLLVLFATSFSLNGQADIFDICRNGSVAQLEEIYKKEPLIINKTNSDGYSPLVLSCYHGNEEVVAFLIDKVTDINGRSDYGTPLMAAVVKGNAKIIDILLKHNANTNLADNNGTTALHYAVMFKNYDVIELLINANADKNLKDNRGQTAIDYAKIFNDETLNNLLKIN